MFVLCKSGTLDFNRGFFDLVETDMPGSNIEIDYLLRCGVRDGVIG